MRVSITDPSPRTIVARDREPPSVQDPAADAAASPFARMLRDLGGEIDAGEAKMRGAVQAMHSGVDLGPASLIAVQIGVYRYSEAVDLVSRVVDRTISGIKTVVQGGGQ